jgi:hypothetical protein
MSANEWIYQSSPAFPSGWPEEQIKAVHSDPHHTQGIQGLGLAWYGKVSGERHGTQGVICKKQGASISQQ